MYEPFFGFSQRPFAAAPTARRFFPASSIDAARQTLARAIDRAEGIGLVIGPPGIGKTVLLHVLAEQFRERFATVVFSAGQLETRRELLQAISFDLGLAYQNKDEGELRLGLVDYLARSDKCPQGMLVLVDEAHVLPANVLEELRMMTNLAKDGEPRVRLVLAGTIRLEEQLAQPKLESFSQRLTARCYLDSFDQAETADYVRFQVAVAGGRLEAAFLPEAVTAVYRATDGVPRLINQICDQALHLAFAQGRRPVDARLIAAAWAELQQLPAPWHDTPAGEKAEPAHSVIEFGQLSDEPEPAAVGHAHAAELPFAAPLAAAAEFNADDTVELAPDVLGELIAGEEAAPATFSADLLPPAHLDLVRAGVRPPLADAQSDVQLLAETAAAFDDIERQVKSLETDEEATPAGVLPLEAVATSAALTPPVATAADPFERFEDEELLLDRYAALDSRNKPPTILPMVAENESPEQAESLDIGEFGQETDEDTSDELAGIHLELSDHAEFFEVVVDPYWELGTDEADGEDEPDVLSSPALEATPRQLPVLAEFPRAREETIAPLPSAALPALVVPPHERGTISPRESTISLTDAIRRRTQDQATQPKPALALSHEEPQFKLRAAAPGIAEPAVAALKTPDAQPSLAKPGSQPELVVVDEPLDEGSVFDTGRLLERQDYRELFARLKRS